MMTTLEAQKQRLLDELVEAREQIEVVKSQPFPDFKTLNYYTDVVSRNTQLIEMIDYHLFEGQSTRTNSWVY